MLDNSNHFQDILNLLKGLRAFSCLYFNDWLQEGRPCPLAPSSPLTGLSCGQARLRVDHEAAPDRPTQLLSPPLACPSRCSLFKQTWKTVPRLCWAAGLSRLSQKLGALRPPCCASSWALVLWHPFCCLVFLVNHRLMANIIYPRNLGLLFFSSSLP